MLKSSLGLTIINYDHGIEVILSSIDVFTVYTIHKYDQEAPLYSEPFKIGRMGYAINIKCS